MENRCILCEKIVSSRTKLVYSRQKIVNKNIGITTIKILQIIYFGIDDFHGP